MYVITKCHKYALVDKRTIFLEDYFYFYFQQIISTIANESLIPYNLTKRAPETDNTVTMYSTPKQTKKV